MHLKDELVNPRPANIREEWGWVRPGIEEVLSLDGYAGYRPEDVYAACLSNEATLWVHPDGFVVTTSEISRYTGEKTFLLWIASAKTRGGAVATDYTAFFEGVAKESKHVLLKTMTPHEPLAEYLVANSGWQKIYTILGKDLQS